MDLIPKFSWNWTDFCSTGIKPFSNDSNDLLPCFQEIILQLPIYTIFAAVSAYHFGIYSRAVTRNRAQLWSINARVFICILLASLPAVKLFEFYRMGVKLNASDILVACAECIMWAVHAGM